MESRIEKRRKELGLTQEDVAEQVGVKKSTVSRWESGTIKEMRRDKLLSLASTLQTSVNYLLGLTDDPSVKPEMSALEKELFRQYVQENAFRQLLFFAGFQESTDEDANVTIYSNDYIIDETPELVERVMRETLTYFSFLMKREAMASGKK